MTGPAGADPGISPGEAHRADPTDDRGLGVLDLAGFLGGAWWLDREVRDPSGTLLATVAGQAWCEARTDGAGTRVEYRETGTLTPVPDAGGAPASALVPPAPTTVARAYTYRVVSPAYAEVYFDHGGFFHDLDLRSGRWQVRHPCGPDTYTGEYVVTGPDSFTQRWHVSGPAKEYVLRTVLGRSGGSAGT